MRGRDTKRRWEFIKRRTVRLLLSLAIGVLSAQPEERDHLLIRAEPPDSHYTYTPMAHSDDLWFGSTFWTGPDWTRVGKDWHHPGAGTSSVRAFVAPCDGTVRVTGCPHIADPSLGVGDGVSVAIRLDGRTLWQAEIDGDDAVGKPHELALNLRAGQTLRFIVHRRGAIPYDTTSWDPLVAYEGGERFQASEGFAVSITEAAPWRYEVDETPDDEVARAGEGPMLHHFTPDMMPRRYYLAAHAEPLLLSASTCLPAVVLAYPGGLGGTILLPGTAGDWSLELRPPDTDGVVMVSWARGTAAPKSIPYEGRWTRALEMPEAAAPLQHVLDRQALEMGVRGLPADLWALVAEDWLMGDGNPASATALLAASQDHLGRCMAMGGAHNAKALQSKARELLRSLPAVPLSDAETERIYVRVRRLKRELLLTRPEMDFDTLLFTKRTPTSYSHLVMQYYGWRARAGGGLFVLDSPGYSSEARDILAGRMERGSVLQPCLDWDGERIAFSYVARADRRFSPDQVRNGEDDAFYHLWTVNPDGTGLQQRTSGPYEDLMPAWLPDGDIMFCSTRRKGYARCFGPSGGGRWNTYTLHRFSINDGAITQCSCNDVSEWFPVVGHDGLVYFSRWDYIDRDAVTHQNLWSARPDGTNPVAVWGNAVPNPHCTFQARPIPGSRKFLFVASAHHSITAGSLAILDPNVGANAMEAIQRITPEIPFPESESRAITEYYAAPWPLAEDLFLTAYSPHPLVWEPGGNRRDALGIYLMDLAGNRELLYRDPGIGCTNPTPLRPRRRPPILASACDPGLGNEGEFMVADVYEGLRGIAARGEVKELRVMQLFPKTTPLHNDQPVGLAGEENARAVLGSVPVREDGSAYFRAPARKPLLFQLLDAEGRAVKTMRSLTYLQPGERVYCVGCHESPGTAPPAGGLPAATQRPPSRLAPGPFEGEPFSYMRVVQPILDEHCVACHGASSPSADLDLTGMPDRGFVKSYWSLLNDADRLRAARGMDSPALVPRYAARNQKCR